MKEFTIISGKGGTGKTTITASFAALAKNAVLVDCDVDAADLHLILNPEVLKTEKFSGMNIASKNLDKCIDCGICKEHCRFNAIDDDFNIILHKCEGCGVCEYVCPEEAIEMVERDSGESYISNTRFGPMAHAKLNIAEEASGKLVAVVRQDAKKLAKKYQKDLILIDGPPGIGCPVIASISGVNLVLVVTEPTLSAIHDMERILGLAEHFRIKATICINKFDINLENTKKIEEYCQKENLEIIGKLPYDNITTKAMIEGKSVVEFSNDEFSKTLVDMWKKVEEML